jgi:hypothetical protein
MGMLKGLPPGAEMASIRSLCMSGGMLACAGDFSFSY